MPLSDILAAALSRPAGRVVEGPVRNIVNEVLADHGYASPAEVAALRADIERARGQVAPLAARLDAVEARLQALAAEADALRAAVAEATAAAGAAQAEAASLRAAVVASAEAAAAAQAEAASLREALRAAPVAPPAAPVAPLHAPAAAPVAETATPAQGAPTPALGDPAAVGCRVSGCDAPHHADGFCRGHFHAWRAGRLPGFVGPEGLLDVGGVPHRVSLDLAGQPYTVSERDGRLRVAGRFASSHAL